MSRTTALIIGIIASLGAANIAMGMMVQVIPLAMDAGGATKFVIGNNAMTGQAGSLLAGLTLVWLRQHLKGHFLVMCALTIGFFCFVGFALTTPFYAWFALRFLIGLTQSIIFTTGESWLQAIAPDKMRGRVMGSYMTSQTLTFALGPSLIKYIGFQGAVPWLIGVAALALALCLMSLVKVEETVHGETPAPLWATARKGWFAFLCVGMVTVFEAFCLTFFTLYAVQNGFSAGSATQLLSFGIAACILFFIPIGYLGDHWSRKGMIGLCALVAMIACAVQGLAISTLWIWPVIVLLRATGFGVYLGGFALLGDKFKGTEMVAASSVNSILWGLSGVIAPPMAGLAMDRFGLGLLPWFMAACFVPIVLVLTTRFNKVN